MNLPDALTLLYEPSESRHWTGVHSIKFDVEHLLWLHKGSVYTTEEAIRSALPGAGFPSRMSRPPKGWDSRIEFGVKPRFPMTWVWNDIKTRPKGVRKAQWDAYQLARTPRVSPDAPQTAGL